MKKLLVALSLLTGTAQAQSRPDSVRQVQAVAHWYDLNLTAPESDSLLESLQEYGETYKAMHQQLPLNSLPYPFAFTPGAFGTEIPKELIEECGQTAQESGLSASLRTAHQVRKCALHAHGDIAL
ncbi:MAG: hypothetical protein EOP50_06805 [Sphingobacteriales bacterium]|nr:MAG: hypothetical protein EOP50_06805 [Sphingobacteriales bacterium]